MSVTFQGLDDTPFKFKLIQNGPMLSLNDYQSINKFLFGSKSYIFTFILSKPCVKY